MDSLSALGAYALARIGAEAARLALDDMVRSDDPYLRQVGAEGLRHWPMPYGPASAS